ncbi:MAG: DUF302 domain-containing protein [Oceanospirillaceae bacterium]|nr:DUF302 domain-containing protein [Oceanospirillaceae bacterium]
MLFLTALPTSAAQHQVTDFAWLYSTQGEFDEIKESLVFAIQEQGAVVSYTAHASDMLARTGKALGITENVYSKAEVVLFCKAEISHKLVAADPHTLVLCPYPIAIYTLTAEPGTVYLSIRKPLQNLVAYQAIQRFLETIITQALDF